MPLHDELPPEDQDAMSWWQFPDCVTCKNRMKRRTCRSCDSGELFEEEDPAGLDGVLHF